MSHPSGSVRIVRGLALLATATWLAGAFTPLQAGLIAYEGFAYTTGQDLGGQDGGLGWSQPWNIPGGWPVTIGASSLAYPGLATTGGSAVTAPRTQTSDPIAFYSRDLAGTLGDDEPTVFLSFLLRPDAGFGFYGGINLVGATGGVYVGRSGDQATYGLEGPNTGDFTLSNVPVSADETVFLVVRIGFQAGADTIDLFVNPGAVLSAPDASTSYDLGTLGTIYLNNAGGYTTDEIRIGTTYADVAAVPEPASLALTSFGLVVAIFSARRFDRHPRGI